MSNVRSMNCEGLSLGSSTFRRAIKKTERLRQEFALFWTITSAKGFGKLIRLLYEWRLLLILVAVCSFKMFVVGLFCLLQTSEINYPGLLDQRRSKVSNFNFTVGGNFLSSQNQRNDQTRKLWLMSDKEKV